ncbi:phage terminase small subunit [Robbsia andropogonis]|uniref:phage terminase small subunit n=1 Tax=Robbsia andropogonis TaxID=28092 RepID=UPI00209F9E89|nr:phage terminase small subunit [Robbsia andropogonis]MCP1116957.1 phage terminase small subunit [Robbsia andropogonis]MCP1126364.1 phage terminase small subunit [Robbsia andropogonis]
MKTPAQRHFERVSAEMAAANAPDAGSMQNANAYELMLGKLHSDRRRMREVASIERRREIKRMILPEYDDYVAGALAGGKGAQDEVLTQLIIWRIDAGDYVGAMEIARYAIAYDMTLPDQFDRPLATAVTEEVAEAALAAFKAGERFDITLLTDLHALVAAIDMHDQVRAKLHKALGYALQVSDGPEALLHLRRAVELDERCGVKKDIARLQAELDASAARQ